MVTTAVVHSNSSSGIGSGGLVWLILIGVAFVVIAFLGTFARGVGQRLPSFLASMPGASSDNSLSFGTVILGSLTVAVLIVALIRS